MKGFRTWSVKLTEDNGETPVSTTLFARKKDATHYANFKKRTSPDKEIWLCTLEPSSLHYQKLVVVEKHLVWQPPF